MDVVELPLVQLIPYARNPRKNESAVATVAASLKEFGWRQPIVVDEDMVILAGHTRLEAARQLGMKAAPVHIARGLTPSQSRAHRLMDRRWRPKSRASALSSPGSGTTCARAPARCGPGSRCRPNRPRRSASR